MRSTAKSLATAPEPFKPSQHFVGCQLAVLGYRIRAKGHRLPNTHILQSAAECETFLGQAGTGRPLVLPRALLNQVSSLDHLAHIVGGIGAKIIAAVGQLSDGHILFLDMIQDNRLRGIESINTFGIGYLPHHFKELAMQTLDHTARAEVFVDLQSCLPSRYRVLVDFLASEHTNNAREIVRIVTFIAIHAEKHGCRRTER